jgi:hypothetical protein
VVCVANQELDLESLVMIQLMWMNIVKGQSANEAILLAFVVCEAATERKTWPSCQASQGGRTKV